METVEYTSKAFKALGKLPKKDSATLVRKINAYAANPLDHHGFAKSMTGGPEVRIRHGQWRAIGEWKDGQFTLFTVSIVGHRKEVYR